jgi:hypothetical protein
MFPLIKFTPSETGRMDNFCSRSSLAGFKAKQACLAAVEHIIIMKGEGSGGGSRERGFGSERT